MPYKASEQERFFATRRIQVLVEAAGTYGHSTYWIVQRDVVRMPGEIAAFLALDYSGRYRRGSRLEPMEWREERIKAAEYIDDSRRCHNRADAIRLAQEQAVALSLPFDPARDVLSWADAIQGPKLSCTACGQELAWRGRPGLCAECTTALAAGRQVMAEQERRPYALEAYDLLPYEQNAPCGRSYNMGLAKALAALAGAVVGKEAGFGGEVIRAASRHRSDNWRFEIILGPAQATAFREVITVITELLEGYFRAGEKAGAAWLSQLADGRLRVDEVQDRQVRGK